MWAPPARLPRPRVLVTTPVHLRTLLADGLELPPLDLIVSATAPLSPGIGARSGANSARRLLEIYGSTETGQIAIAAHLRIGRLPALPGVQLRADNGQMYAYGGHVEQMTAMCDVLEITGADEFILHGRTADLVNVAGKRSSFGYLNSQLNAIPGVVDGAFFLREASRQPHRYRAAGRGGRRAGLSAAALIEDLRRRLDPVFLPRPLLMVDRLPRNATGKLPQQALQSLADRRPAAARRGSRRSMKPAVKRVHTLDVAADHPAFAGHFPGMPCCRARSCSMRRCTSSRRNGISISSQWQVTAAKFLEAARPGDALAWSTARPPTASVSRVRIAAAPRVLTGTLRQRRREARP